MTIELSLDDLGLPAVTEAMIDGAHAQRIAATLDRDLDVGEGSVLPALWHWAYFTPTAATARLGTDGHPTIASPRLAAFPRRMWGAGSVVWHGAVTVGSTATRHTTIGSVKHVTGSSGELMIVGLEHRYVQHDEVVIEEQQSIVYRGQGDSVAMPTDAGEPVPAPGVVQRPGRPDEALLFRFSAVTFNAHRIHYDAPYATQVEGYPGLVVHGPLTSLQLAHHVEHSTGSTLRRWQFKATAPMFAGCAQWFQCDLPDAEGNGEARVLRNDGAIAMTAQYRLGA